MIVEIDCSLNGGSVDCTLHHDSTGDGNSDNSQTLSLSDGTNQYNFDTISETSTEDYWLEFDLTAADYESSPVINSAFNVAANTYAIWDSATDWDGNQVDYGTVHDNTATRSDDEVTPGYDDFFGKTLELYLPMWETSGTTLTDYSSNGADFTLSGGTMGQTGIFGNSVHFDNVDDIALDQSEIVDETGWSQLTFGLWTYYDSSGSSGFLFQGSWLNDILWVNAADNLIFRLTIGGTDYQCLSSMPANQWVFVVGTYDGSTMYLYKDAVEADTIAVSGTVDGGTYSAAIGSKENNDYPYGGNICEVFVLNDYLTPSEIQELHDAATAANFTTSVKNA